MDNTMVFHWGKWVDRTQPTTGVISLNDVAQFVSDEFYNSIDLDYEDAKKEFRKGYREQHNGRYPSREVWDQWEQEMEGFESTTSLIGDWKRDRHGVYYPDPKGEYSAIVRESVIQVVLSVHITKCRALCSPCYPGQADVNSGKDDPDGQFLAYNLPPEAYEY